MRILALLVLAAFAGGAIYLSLYAERTMKRNAKYGSDDLVRAIRMHNEKHKTGTAGTEVKEDTNTKHIIHYGGDVETVITSPSSPQATGNTYRSREFVPETNEGQPGQPLPLTGRPPVNPIYR